MLKIPSTSGISTTPSSATIGTKTSVAHSRGIRKLDGASGGRQKQASPSNAKKSVSIAPKSAAPKSAAPKSADSTDGFKREEQLSINTFRVTIKFLGRSRRKSIKKQKRKGPPPGFHAEQMSVFLHGLLEEYMEDYKYDGGTANIKVKEVSTLILDKVKEKELGRYKYVCYVAISDVNSQGLEIGTRCLSNPKTDDHVSVVLQMSDYYVVAVLHAIHLD